MSISDNYEVNVAKDGKHFCRIELGWDLHDIIEQKFNTLKKIFGDEYELTLTLWTCRGETK